MDENTRKKLMETATMGANLITAEEEAITDQYRGTTSMAGANLYAPKVGHNLFGHAHLHVYATRDQEDGYHLQRDEVIKHLGMKHDQKFCDDR